MPKMRRHHALLTLAVLVGLVGATAATVYGAVGLAGVPDDNGVFHACVQAPSGQIRMVSEGEACPETWNSVSWNQIGPPGPPGPPGPSDGFAIERRTVQVPSELGPVATLSLPEGDYMLNASLSVNNNSGTQPAVILCSFSPPALFDFSILSLKPFVSGEIQAAGTVAMTSAVEIFFSQDQTVSVRCMNNVLGGGDAVINDIVFSAVKVATFSQQTEPPPPPPPSPPPPPPPPSPPPPPPPAPPR